MNGVSMGFFKNFKKSLGIDKKEKDSQKIDSNSNKMVDNVKKINKPETNEIENKGQKDKTESVESLENKIGNLNVNKPTQSKSQESQDQNERRNFKYLYELIHSGSKEIVLDCDIALDDNEISEYCDGIKLNSDSLLIDGNGHSIDGRNKVRIFYCEAGKVTIKNIILKNGKSDNGGAICNFSEMAIINGTIENSIADNVGGAICNWGILTISNSKIINNVTHSRGGAIHNMIGNLKIRDCEISNNKSPNNIISNNGTLELNGCSFTNNQSKHIISNDSSKFDLAGMGIFNGEFTENDVGESVICNNGKFCTVEGSRFEGNASLNIINRSDLTIINPKINNDGKSILNEGHIEIKKSPPELENIICGEGTVEISEKLIPQGENFDFGYLDKKIHESNSEEIILDHDITLEKYEIDFYEGGIELDLDNLIIDGNGKTIDGLDKSRIFIITGKNITLKNVTFKNGHSYLNYDNILNCDGAAVKINGDSDVRFENCRFQENQSEQDGGAVSNRNGNLSIFKSLFKNNNARLDGGAIDNDNGDIHIVDSSLLANTVNNYGGAIHNNTGKVNISSSKLCGNSGGSYGGAIYSDGETIVNDSQFYHNSSNKGGAIFNRNALNIIGSELNDNEAKFGGAIENERGTLTILDSTLKNNKAVREGGAVNINRSELSSFDIKNCKLENNKPNDIIYD